MTKPTAASQAGLTPPANAQRGKRHSEPIKPVQISVAESATPPADAPEIYAAGAVVLRDGPTGREVLMVHRPNFRDWALPKGKLDPGELLPVAAVREVWEETGVRVRLGHPVTIVRYPIPKGIKVVYWWVGHVLSERPRKPDQEIDQVAWVNIDQAASTLTYPDEHEVLLAALELDAGASMLLVRHAKSQSRKSFRGKNDAERPLSSKGQRQADQLVKLLDAFGVAELVTSSSTRCVQTLEPYAEAATLPLRSVDLLSEEGAQAHPRQVQAYLGRLRVHAASKPHKPMAICGHRPVFPAMFAGLGLDATELEPAEIVIVHLNSAGHPIALEDVPAPVVD